MALALTALQTAVTLIIGVYFLRQLCLTRPDTDARHGYRSEMARLVRMRKVRLSEPLAERTRPARMEDIVGQQDGLRSLSALLCGANPQHVLIYGPPGVGKTCAARLALEAAKRSPGTPFRGDAPFVEMDASALRYDERAIADPLIGSVHDPIYQGAGHLGAQGVPQPKPGAVTRAHGGVLFLDEIGEMHPAHMAKLLKVLEDRQVRLDSAYYRPDDPLVPRYIHEVFKHGLPADFRLIGATTRSAADIPPALRSRCMEVYFRSLDTREIAQIALGAARRAGFVIRREEAMRIGEYALSGRDAVNMVQMAAALARQDGRASVLRADVDWVIRSGRCALRADASVDCEHRIGRVHALAITGAQQGVIIDVEAAVRPGSGRVRVSGVVEEEEVDEGCRAVRRRSAALSSADTVETVLRARQALPAHLDVHINFPGSHPIDGPSAGVAMAVAALSALSGRAVSGTCAVTGELGVRGDVRAVGGVTEKMEAARRAGMRLVLLPLDNLPEADTGDRPRVAALRVLEDAIDRLLPRDMAIAP